MFQVRVHGRGGQGVVTAAELLSVAAFLDGHHAQAFPSFGSERMGAPVMAFCRISSKPIRAREPVLDPDALIIQDPTLMNLEDPWRGAGPDAFALVNSPTLPPSLITGGSPRRVRAERVVALPASEIALAQVGRPIPNAALLGGFAALTGAVSFEAIATAIRARFGGTLGERNVAAAAEAFRMVAALKADRVPARVGEGPL